MITRPKQSQTTVVPITVDVIVNRSHITTIPVVIDVVGKLAPVTTNVPLVIVIEPIETPVQRTNLTYTFNINAKLININLSQPIIQSAFQYLQTAYDTYIDEDRKLKTLLNYGEDRQTVLLNYRYGDFDSNNINKIQLKLLQPLPDNVGVGSSVFLSREVAKTLIDKVRIRFAPPLDTTPYLRPRNTRTDNGVSTGNSIQNVTLKQLQLISGSVGTTDSYKNKTFEDEIFRQWYSYDFNSSELNIDFSDYSNFVFYGSAAMRLAAFKEKLANLERIEHNRNQFLSSSTYTVSNNLVGSIFVQEKTAQYAKEKEDIIRGFDRYEQYLYFTPSGSNSPYSASAFYVDGQTEYNSLGYWPKNSSGSVYTTYDPIATTWYGTQLQIAQRFDEFNENNLVNTIPTHVREHDDNAAYLTFVAMVGHFFDTIKPYIDQFPEIYNRNLDPNKFLSKDLVNEIAESIGFTLPTLNSVYNLTDNILGTDETEPRRTLTAEIYKRLLHNLPFYAKSKGTRTSLDAFIRTFGIQPQLISIKETSTPTTGSYYTFDEFSTGIKFVDSKTSYIRIPVSASRRNPTTLQFNLSAGKNKLMTILTGDDAWGLNLVPHPVSTELGRIEVTSGSNILLSSSYCPIFNGELFNLTLQNTDQTSSLYVARSDGEELLFNNISNVSNTFPSKWKNTEYIYFGAAGLAVKGRYEGTVDEIRLWSDTLSDEVIVNSIFDPGSNAGDTYQAASDHLLIQLSFNNLTSASLASSSIKNESPYKNKSISPSLENLFLFNISGSDFVRYNRLVRQDMVIAGSSGFITNKIKVAPPPKFLTTLTKRLYRTKSIVQPESKRIQIGRNKVIMSMSPTDIINQNIIRNFGYENLNATIGAATADYNLFAQSLNTLKKYYQQYYYVDVNFNKFTRILSSLSSVLDEVVGYFIPSKATLLKGITIEQNLLEQVRIPAIKDLKLYGKDSRRTLNAPNSLLTYKSDYGATFNVSKNITSEPNLPTAKYLTYVQEYKVDIVKDISAITNKYFGNITHLTSMSGSTSTLLGKLNISNTELNGIQSTYSGLLNKDIQEITASVGNLKVEFVVNNIDFSDSYVSNIKTEFNANKIDFSNSNRSDLNHIFDINNIKVTGSCDLISGPIKDTPLPDVAGTAFYYDKYYENSDINLTPTLTSSSYQTFNINHEKWNYIGPPRDSKIDMNLHRMNKISYNAVNYGSEGAEPYNRIYPRKLFPFEIEIPRKNGTGSLYMPGVYDIQPTTDFRDFGVCNFFNDPEGIYYFSEIKKIPAYPRPLNQTWDMKTQTFNSVVTWSYGSRHNLYDVVYQDITTDDFKSFPTLDKKSVNAGNKKYYVFKTRPANIQPLDGSTFYSGSVPSYTPPSLDKNNWEPLRFTPVQTRVPKRVVFDTYTVSFPELNNFKTTTISINEIIDIPDRYIDSFTLPSIGANSYITGELSLQNIGLLFAVQFNLIGLRLRLYRTSDAAILDLNRPLEVRPTGSHGVLIDMPIINNGLVQITNPITTLVAGETPSAGKIFYTINNLDSNTKLSPTILMYYFALQIERRIPKGYLRKHYRFFRDNSTALKRRNYLGCKNTQETTIDGLPPIQIFLSEGTDLVISPTQTNTEIITGGGGTLNVT